MSKELAPISNTCGGQCSSSQRKFIRFFQKPIGVVEQKYFPQNQGLYFEVNSTLSQI